MSSQLPKTKLAADGITPMASKLNKKELKICLDEHGLDYNAEASNAALKEILLAHLKRLKDSDSDVNVRKAALRTLSELEPASPAQYANALVAKLEDPDKYVRQGALKTLRKVEPAMLAQHANALVARLEDSDWEVRMWALETLGMLEQATLAQHVVAVVAKLDESEALGVRLPALETLRKLEPATLLQHASAVVAMLEDYFAEVRLSALETLGKLEPAKLLHHALTVVARLEDEFGEVRQMACHTLAMLPRYVRYATRGIDGTELLFGATLDHGEVEELSSRLLGRMAWYKCRIRLRVRSISLYWYALLYRPSGPGHTRDVEAWDHMIQELHS